MRRIGFHDLRHTYASLLISQAENIKFVQSQLGHASAKTTLDRYGHLMPNHVNDAARKLDYPVFGDVVRKLVEDPESEGNYTHKEEPEVIKLQELRTGGGGPQLTQVEEAVPGISVFIGEVHTDHFSCLSFRSYV